MPPRIRYSVLLFLFIASMWPLMSCGPKLQLTPLEPAAPPIEADSGMVVAAHPLAAQAGVQVLREGGNAVDAAIAALFVLNVVEPNASGLGGGGFALVRMAGEEPVVVNYRERAPKDVDTAFYYNPLDSLKHLRHGGASVCVPGAAAGWAEMFDRWGTMPLERLTRDGVKYAEEGFPVSPGLSRMITDYIDVILSDSLLAAVFTKNAISTSTLRAIILLGARGQLSDSMISALVTDSLKADALRAIRPSLAQWGDAAKTLWTDGTAPDSVLLPFSKQLTDAYIPGDTLRQPNLGQTFRDLTARGLRSFYRGPIAEAVVEAVRSNEGVMTLKDLEFYRVEIAEPLALEYNNCTIYTIPPPSAGGATLIEALNLISLTRASNSAIGSVLRVHLTAQCIAQAYADAEVRIGDPEFIRTDWRRMTTAEFASQAANGIDAKAKAAPRTAVPRSADLSDHGNTTHLVVIDGRGNMVSITQSINYFFGAGVMAGATGILLNNQAADFSAPPDSLNLIGSRKRPRSQMTPVLALKGGKPFIVLGTPGGSRITSSMVEILTNAADGGMDISAAIDYPRFFPIGEHLVLENRFSKETVKGLMKLGYQLHFGGPYHLYFGGAHGIMMSPDGRLLGSADKRRGGAAKGY